MFNINALVANRQLVKYRSLIPFHGVTTPMMIDLNGHPILRQSTINLVFRLQTLPDLGNSYVPDCPAQVEL